MNVGQIVKGVDDGQSHLNVTNSLKTVIDSIHFKKKKNTEQFLQDYDNANSYW